MFNEEGEADIDDQYNTSGSGGVASEYDEEDDEEEF
jgi:hypothetical protein